MKGPIRVLFSVVASAVLLAASAVPAGGADQSASSAGLEMYEAVVDRATALEMEANGFDILDSESVGEEQVRVELVLSTRERSRLENLGVETELWRNAQGLTSRQLAARQRAGGYSVWRSFDEPGGIRQEINKIAKRNRDIVKRRVIGRSVQGRPIIALKLTEDAREVKDGARPSVLYMSLQHAREWISLEVNRRLLHWYIDQYRAKNKKVRKVLRTTELWFVLVVNPDGYEYTHDVERLWRKNLRDNDGNGQITGIDGVDPNRNYPEHWGYDEEGSSSIPSSETYRGAGPASEPETQAMIRLMKRGKFQFLVNYHSFGQLLLYPQGWQVQTPSADDPIYTALSGTDSNPAIEGYDPDLAAELYIVNGDTTDYAHSVHRTLAWTPELGEGNPAGGFVFPDDEAQVQREFEINLPFAWDLARSARNPAKPKSHTGLRTEPFHFDTTEMDPYKDNIPGANLQFPYSYGDPQPVRIMARRSVKKPTLNWRVNGGKKQKTRAFEWHGGTRWGGKYDVYYHYVQAEVTGTNPGDNVEVWFTGKQKKGKKRPGKKAKFRRVRSDAFTYRALEESDDRVLILAAEDYTGASSFPPSSDTAGPDYLGYYTSALDSLGIGYDVYDVDARGREAPDQLGVLGHYDVVIWYTGDDLLTRDPEQPGGTGAARLANEEMLHVRAYLNERGRLLFTGQNAGYQYANAFDYRPLGEPPYCDNVDQTVDDDCLALSDDFLQYYLGAYLYIADGGTNFDTGEPYPVDGVNRPYEGLSWEFNGPDSAQNQAGTGSMLTTSSLLKPDQYPQFESWAPARWRTGISGPYEPHSGSYYMYSDRADISYKRMTRTITVPASGATMTFWTSYDTEPAWDFFFVEAHTVGQDNWQTLPDENGNTSNDTGDSCPAGWHELHPHLAHYQTFVGGDPSTSDDDTCSPTGTSGTWNATSGNSHGWQQWEIDLAPFAGQQIELSLSYASDWAVQGLGVWIDDIVVSTGEGTTNFESDTGGWQVPGAPAGSDQNPNDFRRTTSVGYEEGAVVATRQTLYFGFGFEGITDEERRRRVMRRAMLYLLP